MLCKKVPCPLTRSVAPDKQGTWGLHQEVRNLGSDRGTQKGEFKNMELTEAGESVRLSMEALDSGQTGKNRMQNKNQSKKLSYETRTG
jgi:hypothetical protein